MSDYRIIEKCAPSLSSRQGISEERLLRGALVKGLWKGLYAELNMTIATTADSEILIYGATFRFSAESIGDVYLLLRKYYHALCYVTESRVSVERSFV